MSSWTISGTERSTWKGCMRRQSVSLVFQMWLITWASSRSAPRVRWKSGSVDSRSYRVSMSSGWKGYVSTMRFWYSIVP